MATQDDYVKTALRLPRELHASLLKDAEEAGRSMNAEIIDRLSLDNGPVFGVLNKAIDSQKSLTRLMATMVLLATGAAGKSDPTSKRLLELVEANAQTYIEKGQFDFGGQVMELMSQLETVIDEIPEKPNQGEPAKTPNKVLRRTRS